MNKWEELKPFVKELRFDDCFVDFRIENAITSPARKILIVDDEREIRELVRETVMIDNFEILEAETGDAAYDIILKEHPDLIILDVKMPGTLDGLSLTQKIKGDPTMRDIPIILLTAVPVDLEQNSRLNPDAIFYKPFSPIDLLDRISDIFGE
ncbi:MAG: response regulator [Calditrichaeota bacterium]|nr:response regulator [Calditrichota bacterium]